MFFRSNIPTIDSSELKERREKGENFILLDVRTPHEWDQTGVIPGSLMIPDNKIHQEIERGLNLDRDNPVIVICRSGNRSKSIAKDLVDKGVDAYNLKGGIKGWYRINGEIEHI